MRHEEPKLLLLALFKENIFRSTSWWLLLKRKNDVFNNHNTNDNSRCDNDINGDNKNSNNNYNDTNNDYNKDNNGNNINQKINNSNIHFCNSL